jgi:hypothetical protein
MGIFGAVFARHWIQVRFELAACRRRCCLTRTHGYCVTFWLRPNFRDADFTVGSVCVSSLRYLICLYVGFIALPIIAGADKFFDLLTNGDTYLAPRVHKLWALTRTFMLLVGVIQIVAGLIVLVRRRFGTYKDDRDGGQERSHQAGTCCGGEAARERRPR